MWIAESLVYLTYTLKSVSAANVRANAANNMFARLGTDYEIRNGGYFESIKNSANFSFFRNHKKWRRSISVC